MLTFEDHFRQAGRWHRGQFLRVGGLALGGLTLGDWFAVRAAAKAKRLSLKDRSVIFPGLPQRVAEAMTRGAPIRGLV